MVSAGGGTVRAGVGMLACGAAVGVVVVGVKPLFSADELTGTAAIGLLPPDA